VLDLPSKSNEIPSVNPFPIHRIANALKICPCATISTSPDCRSSAEDLPIAFSWKRERMSCISLSRRLETSFGDLCNPQSLATHLPFTSPQKFPHSIFSQLPYHLPSSGCGRTYSPPGHPSCQISQLSLNPFAFRSSRICGLVFPSYSP